MLPCFLGVDMLRAEAVPVPFGDAALPRAENGDVALPRAENGDVALPRAENAATPPRNAEARAGTRATALFAVEPSAD